MPIIDDLKNVDRVTAILTDLSSTSPEEIELQGMNEIPLIKGKSAYEIAVIHGFEGTEEEWLDSLKVEFQRSANEFLNETKADEEERKSNESERIENENSRIEQEQARVVAEQSRVQAESTRVSEFEEIKSTYSETRILTIEGNIDDLKSDSGASVDLSIDSNYLMTLMLKNKTGETVSTSTIDFPIESMVVNASYSNGVLTLVLQNGNTLDVDISAIVNGLVNQDTFDTAAQQLQQELTSVSSKVVPTGGSAGQVLAKNSDDDNDVEWISLTTSSKKVIIVDQEIKSNTNYEVPQYIEIELIFNGCKLIKDINYIEVDNTHVQFKDWNVPKGSNLEIIYK